MHEAEGRCHQSSSWYCSLARDRQAPRSLHRAQALPFWSLSSPALCFTPLPAFAAASFFCFSCRRSRLVLARPCPGRAGQQCLANRVFTLTEKSLIMVPLLCYARRARGLKQHPLGWLQKPTSNSDGMLPAARFQDSGLSLACATRVLGNMSLLLSCCITDMTCMHHR